jgi:hypothetical protein
MAMQQQQQLAAVEQPAPAAEQTGSARMLVWGLARCGAHLEPGVS